MRRNLPILLTLALVIALPFLLRSRDARRAAPDARTALRLVILTPHNEAIRQEFARAFSAWHQERFGVPVKVDWLAIGGTTEIARYLDAQYTSALRGWWTRTGHAWLPGAGDALLDRKFNEREPPSADAESRWRTLVAMRKAFRETDDPAAFTVKADLLFGGGQYDHQKLGEAGFAVPPWPAGGIPDGLLEIRRPDGTTLPLIPERMGGEIWRGPTYYGTVLSTFGICCNLDRLRELGIAAPPRQWSDLAAPAYFRQVGLADPTKSGSIAKAFELIVHQQCRLAVGAAGFDDARIEAFEDAIKKARLPPGECPPGIPAAYQEALKRGWIAGVNLLRRIGANARYFTDSSGKVPIDVCSGQAAAGLAIDFFARFQAESNHRPQMLYIAPDGGTSASCDPISLLRGAEHRETAVRFIEFVLRPEGQRLWTYRAGTPGGPARYPLRRLPIRADFYPCADPARQAEHERHRAWASDDLAAPVINPYAIAARFTYRPRWTAGHFGMLRDLVRAMCLDSFDELQAAWGAILKAGGPAACPAAVAELEKLPPLPNDRARPLDWRSALNPGADFDRLDALREWTVFFRAHYRRAAELANGTPPP